MQAPKENKTPIFRPRLAWRAFFGVLLIALVFAVVGHFIARSAETRARQDFIAARQKLVVERLGGMHVDVYRNAPYGYLLSDVMLADLRSLVFQGQLAYLVLLDKSGAVVAKIGSGFREETLSDLARSAAMELDLPDNKHIALEGMEYLNTVLELPRTDGLRVAYGINSLRLSEVGGSLSILLTYVVLAGVAALFLSFLFFLFYVVRPLRRTLLFFGSGQAQKDAPKTGEAEREDELGAIWRRLFDLEEGKKQLEGRPVLDTRGVIAAFSPLLDELPHGIIIISPEGTARLFSRAARRILRQDSVPPQTHVLPLLEEFFHPEQFAEFKRRYGLLPKFEDSPLEFESEDADGRTRGYDIRLSRHNILGEECTLCILYDMSHQYRLRMIEAEAAAKLEQAIGERTDELMKVNEQLRQENAERRAIEQALVRAESRYREIVNNSIEGIFQRTADGRMLSANASLARVLGYGSVDELLNAYQKPGMRICYTSEMEFAITELLDIRGWVSNLEFQAVMQDGSPVWVAMNARRVADSSGETLFYEAFIEDITSRKKTEEKLVYQAFHDPLTGLPNRALFHDRLRMALRRSKRHGEYVFAVLYLDLDRFKNINDSFGHSAGDKMLKHTTEKLLQCVRDLDTVARFGGDEFAVLLADLEKPSQAVLIARRIADALNETVNFHGQEISIGASIGIVLSTLEYNTPEEILRDADTAMYRAKMRGRRRYTVFNERMREETIAALALESDLRGAVDRGEIEAFYQPLIDLEGGSVTGFEALMRWRRNGEIISPVAFIPIAEETGLIYELGLEILRIVGKQVVEWTKSLGHCDFVVHVNISSKQLMAKHFWRDVQEVLAATGVNPRQLIFEITESVFLDYGGQVMTIMNMVRDYGIRFCLDDFGTGFSSLSYLRLLPLESLKVDRSFIVDIKTDNYSEAILRNLVSMGRDLGLKVITEGVDQPEQVDVLRSVGCKHAQGFFFAEPLPAPEAIAYMRRHGCQLR